MCNKHCEYCNILREELYLITLPCGYIVCYGHLQIFPNLVDCFMCKEHIIDLNHCLNMKKNRDKISEINRLAKLTNLKQKLDKINSVKNDPKYFIDECFSNLTNKIDLRREQIKIEFSKSVDKSFQNIYQQVKSLQEEYEKNLDKNLKNFEMSDLKENLDSIEIDEIEKIKIKPLVNYLDQIEKISFQNSNYTVHFSNNDLGQIINIIYETKLSNELSKIKKSSESCFFYSKDISILPTGEIVGVSNLDPRNLSIWNHEKSSITEFKGEDFIIYSTVTSSGHILCLDDNLYLKVWLNGDIINIFQIIEFDIYNYCSINSDDSILIFYERSFICLLNFLTGYMKQFKAHESPLLSSLLFSQNEYLTSHKDNLVNLWDIVNNTCLRTKKFQSRVVCMAKLNDKEIVVGTESGEIIGLEVSSFKRTQFVKTGNHEIEFIRFVEDDLFLCSIKKQLKLWKNSNGAFRVVSKKYFSSLEDALILPNGKILILDQNYQATIWS